MRIRPLVNADDLWIGVYRDRERHRWYVCLLPCLGFVIHWDRPPREIDEHVDPRDELIHSLSLYIGRHIEKQLTTAQKELLYDIASPGGHRWWRCRACDHASIYHTFGPGGLAAGGPRPCTRCSCPDFEDNP